MGWVCLTCYNQDLLLADHTKVLGSETPADGILMMQKRIHHRSSNCYASVGAFLPSASNSVLGKAQVPLRNIMHFCWQI